MRLNHTLKKRNRGNFRSRLLSFQTPKGVKFSSAKRNSKCMFTLKRRVRR